MIRKLLFGALAVFLVGGLVFGRSIGSYIKTGGRWVRETVKESVPVQFEIDRARQLVRDLDPEIRKNMHLIAKEEVEVEKLQQQIVATEGKLNKDKADVLRLKGDLTSGKSSFEYGGRTYTVSQVKSDLTNRFDRFKTAEATLASLKDIHTARERSLNAARQKLDGMQAAKRKLEVDVENLAARQKIIEVAQASSTGPTLDDSHLAQTKDLLDELRGRLSVAEKLVQADSTPAGEIPLEENKGNILDQVTEYFGTTTDKVAEVSH